MLQLDILAEKYEHKTLDTYRFQLHFILTPHMRMHLISLHFVLHLNDLGWFDLFSFFVDLLLPKQSRQPTHLNCTVTCNTKGSLNLTLSLRWCFSSQKKLFKFRFNTEFPQCIASGGEDGAAPPFFISDCTDAALGAGISAQNKKPSNHYIFSGISIKSCG